ncbi:bifunctional diaminohydroxyphosphoribosylaminopyrimidine deaminase/5-amino-6-(5-phosphoribosylamino)uracil reductase RibD [Thermodesulfobacteriota bacterium]
MRDKDTTYMRKALGMAVKGLGKTSPNPAVGAVIVRNDVVIASGYHKGAGENHAEVDALSRLKGRIKSGDTMYVTLEPCNHQGRTPPCTRAILKSGIRKVVIGMKDPNPLVKGGGIQYLREKGIKVATGVLEKECEELLEPWVKFSKTGRPFVIAKSALTLDGWTAASTGNSKWVTGERAREYVHSLRSQVDGIMVGIGTVLADDPMLTSRLKRGKGRNPHRIIVDTHLKIPSDARLLMDDSGAFSYIASGRKISRKSLERIEKENIFVLKCPVRNGRVDLNTLMDIIGKKSITSILIEGGSNLMGSMIREKLIDKFLIFKAPKLLGGGDGIPMAAGKGPRRMAEAVNLKDVTVKKYGEDLLITGYPEY